MQPVPHMTNDEFRRLGHQMVDFIADYWDALEREPQKFSVLSRVRPGEVFGSVPPVPPEAGRPLVGCARAEARGSEDLFADIDRLIMPGITHWQHPHFYAYFPANATGPSVLAELLSAGLGVQGMLWATSPACTELETRMLDWLGGMIGLPADFLSTSANGGGVIEGTASDAALVAMVAARERVRKSARGQGGPTPDLVAYTSTQAHSSIIKAAMIAGIATGPDDRTHVRLIDVDSEFRMRADLLEAAMREDTAAGRTPFFVCATVGTTGCTAIDPIPEIAAAIARTTSSLRLSVSSSLPPWLHIDAAHAGAACVCPEYRHWLAGVEHADSICFNPHKWLLTNFDCNCFWTRDRATLTSALSITPEYLRNAASDAGAVVDYRDWQVPLGRRFRSLKLWFVIRHYGVEGLRAYIHQHMAMAQDFERWVRSDPRFEVVAPRTMNLICFRLRALPGQSDAARDAMNRRLLDALNASGRLHLSHAALPGVGLTLRMAIGAVRTREEHVKAAWAWIQEEAARATLVA
ncbi:MAG TPA: pyridoxal-dependent decarboxylase [Phycisphaerales bacterium]|nr:pyridoxal-dependent decarboxylase [Phycisphaerales bacterium]